MLLAVVLWSILAMATATPDPYGINFKEMNSTTGIIFVPFSKVQLTYKEWKLVYYYDLNEYYEEVAVIEHFYYKLTDMCNRAVSSGQDDFGNACHLAIPHAGLHINKIVENQNIIESFNSHATRKKEHL